MKRIAEFKWLPFQMGAQEKPTNHPLPDRLPFRLAREETTGLLVQSSDKEISGWLSKMYRVSVPYGTPMSETGLGRRYAEDFLAYVLRSLNRDNLRGLRVVEIGCGYGYLLKRLLDLGADAVGIEPGPSGTAAKASGLPVVNEEFRRELIEPGVDLFVEYGVLEHIEDYRGFLTTQREKLSPGGQIILSVPDCTWPIAVGDISMLVHEHWNYFTKKSLSALAGELEFSSEDQELGGVGGTLYSTWRISTKRTNDTVVVQDDQANLQERFEMQSLRIQSLLRRWSAEGGAIGIFVPGRILNYLPSIDPLIGMRFFDDDPNLRGKFYPPFEARIESRTDLIESPVDRLLIMSASFGSQIADSLRSEPSLRNMEIATLADALSTA